MSELKKKIKPGLIELDPVEPVIIVHITNLLLDPNQLGEDGQPLVVQKTQEQKRIKLKTFRATSTISKFAQAVVENCPFIHASKEPQIQQLLEQLKQRMLANERADSPVQKPPPTVDTTEDSDEEAKLVNDVPRQTRPKSAARTRTGSTSNTTSVRQPPAPQQSESPKNSTPQHRLSSSAANSSLTMSVNGSFAANTSINVKESNMLSNMRSSQTRSSLSQQPEEDEEAQPVSKKSSKSQSRKSFDQDERKEDDDGEERVVKKKKKKDKDAISDGVEKKKKKKKSLDASLREPERERSNSFSEPESPREEAYMNQLDTYSEELYEEDMKHKVHGTKMILKLVQNPVNLEHFIDNETMLGALARVLQEDHKKSTKLVTNILEIFFCFSSFSQLHGILLNNKIGDATMKIVDLEIKRYEMRMEKQDNDGLARYLASQERLLFVCFYILLNLSEDTAIEYKMKQRHIVKHLVRMLNRTNRDRKFLDELLLLIVTFLKKLSIFEENKTEMVSYQILSKLLNFLDTTNEDLLEAVLRLVFNLSFDAQQRAELVSRAMIPRFVNILQRQLCRPVTIRLLYNISMDHQHRHVLDQMLQPAIPMLVQWIIRSPNKYVDRELLALAINLATTPTNIELMCAQDGLHHMIKRVHQTFDPLLMKLIRTISEQTGPTQHIFKKYLHELVGMALKSQNHDFLVEVLAVLANISLPDVLYSELLIKHGLLDFLVKHLVPGFADDDIVLECIMIVGTMASDPKSAPILANARFIRILYELLTEKIEDVEIVTQTVYALFKMLLHKETREAIALHPNLSNSLLDLVVDPAPEVRHFANACLDMIMDHDMEWREKIRGKRFEAFNREWLALAAKGNMGTGYPGLESPTSSNFGGGKSPGGYGDYYPGGQYGDAESPYSGLGSSEHRHYMNQLDDSMDG